MQKCTKKRQKRHKQMPNGGLTNENRSFSNKFYKHKKAFRNESKGLVLCSKCLFNNSFFHYLMCSFCFGEEWD